MNTRVGFFSLLRASLQFATGVFQHNRLASVQSNAFLMSLSQYSNRNLRNAAKFRKFTLKLLEFYKKLPPPVKFDGNQSHSMLKNAEVLKNYKSEMI